MPVSLIKSLAYGEADVTTMRFDRVRVRASFQDITERECKGDKVDTSVTVTWKVEESIKSIDGRELAPGKTLRDTTFVQSKDPESVERWQGRGKRILCALRKIPTTSNDVGEFDVKDLRGKEVSLYLTYTPSKDNPSDLEKGFQNFAYDAVE